ncbi:MAG TPA: alanine--tRNA ligase-related protein, partial [Chitinophagaceae bacterium]|nr:alanine--tRNA ligase-related protein [Chitinophagaceae bacterium]
ATTIDTEDWIILQPNTNNTFVGYNQFNIKTKVVQYRKVVAKGKEQYQLVLQQTPFYAESGGQIGDTGILHFNNEPIEVINTKKENDLIVHYIEALPTQIEVEVVAEIDITKRLNTTLHHSATHLLHAALRKVLGTHVAQKGSLVNEEHLRFDFSHFAKITDEELQKIETLVNEKIRENVPIIIKELPKEEALKLGAMALFGEKYDDVVRVVIMDENYSVELCGGTHIAYTGQLGYFKITSETGVAAGVRRIEAVSGIAAENYINTKLLQLNGVSATLKNPKDVIKAIQQIQEEQSQQKKYVEKIENRLRNIIIPTLINKKETINNISFIGSIVDVPNAEMLKKLCLDIKNELADYVTVLAANIDGKAAVAISIAETIVNTKGFDANKIIKEIIAPLINGSGGGQKTLSSAVGQDISKLKDVMEHVRKIVSQ